MKYEVTFVFVLLSGRGQPTECRQRTKSPFPNADRTDFPIRVMTLMLTTTYGESVSSTPILERGDPTGPMLKGITYMVRPVRETHNHWLHELLLELSSCVYVYYKEDLLKYNIILVSPFMQPGNRCAIALSNSSGDIQRPSWLTPPPSGVGTVSL